MLDLSFSFDPFCGHQLQFWKKHSNRKISISDWAKKSQTSNETHSKLGLDLELCPQSISKSKRGLTTTQNSHKRGKIGKNNYGRNTATEN